LVRECPGEPELLKINLEGVSPMRVRIALALALVGGLLATAMAPASAAVTGPGGSGLVAGSGVVTLVNQAATPARAASGAAIQATPTTRCNVSVRQPQLSAALILTATWQVDCRSGADPNRSATDVASTDMEVRIYQGDPTFGETGTNIAGSRCTYVNFPNVTCSTSTSSPIQYYTPYYSTLQVTVILRGGGTYTGSFHTYASRLS
jgi:hypothetical protein